MYWEQAGLDEEKEKEQSSSGGHDSHAHPAPSRKRKGNHVAGDRAAVYPTASTSASDGFRAPGTKSAWARDMAAPINKELPEDDEDEEEFTFNPDQELQDYQADGHAYEAAGQYERIEFGE